MKRGDKIRKKQKQLKGSVLAKKNNCREIVLIDAERIRNHFVKEIHGLQEKIALLKAEHERFITVDEPAFRGWIEVELKDRLARLRSMREKKEADRIFFDEIDRLVDLFDLHPGEAYEIMTNPQAREKFEAEQGERAKRVDSQEEEESEFEDQEAFKNEFRDTFKSFFGFDLPPDADPFGGRSQQEAATALKHSPIEQDRTVKQIYREIVKKLHPDRAESWSVQEKNLWNQAQLAYQENDLSTLQEIILSLDDQSIWRSVKERISEMKERLKRFQKEHFQKEREIRELRKAFAWRFNHQNKKTLESIRGVLDREMEEEIEDLIYAQEHIDRDYDRLRWDHGAWKDKIARVESNPPSVPKTKKKRKKKGTSELDPELDLF